MAEIKVSDIILDIQKKVTEIQNTQKMYDYQLKLIISNFNKFFEAQKNEPQETTQEKKQRLMTIKKTSEELNNNIKKIELPKLNEEEEDEIDFKVQTVGNFDTNEKKSPVSQKVTSGNGEPVVGALVMIKDQNNKFLTIKTNTNGKWQALLPVGKYKVTVGTLPHTDGPRIQYDQTFEVTTTDRPLEITAPKL